MGCPLLQNTKHTQAEAPLGSSDTLMSQLVMEQLNSAVKEPSGDPEAHGNKPGAGGSMSPALLSLGHIQALSPTTKWGGQKEAKSFTGPPVSSAEFSLSLKGFC